MGSVPSLEAALQQLEGQIEEASKVVKRLQSILAVARRAAVVGDLVALQKSRRDIAEAASILRVRRESLDDAWPYDETAEIAYLEQGEFVREFIRVAGEHKLEVFEESGQLMSHPSIMKLDPRRRMVLIDRKPHRGIRPTHLVRELKAAQARPPRFKTAVFLDALFRAWRYARAAKGPQSGDAIRIAEIYDAWTVSPGARNDYSLQEFGQDLYRLEDSEARHTRDGYEVQFHRSTTTKSGGGVTVVGRDGRRVLYGAVSFVAIPAT